MTSEMQKTEAEREAAEVAALGEGNEDWGQFLCEDCDGCDRREVCFNR